MNNKSNLCINDIHSYNNYSNFSLASVAPKSITCSTSTSFNSKPFDVVPLQQKLKSKDKKKISVYLAQCRYELIRTVIKKLKFKEVTENDNWSLLWTDMSISVERCKGMKRYQKINHFPGMMEICRKDLLARNLNRMRRVFPKEYKFFPRTWCLPSDINEIVNYAKLYKNKTFILKPGCGSQGRGIIITKSIQDIQSQESRGICQIYLEKPFLIEGYKFDLRIYTLITCCDPLRIYIFKEGLVRFATCLYKNPNGINVSNVFMHLTNYAVNKHSRTYNKDVNGYGSKRKLSWLKAYLKNLNHDVDAIWNKIDDAIIKTVISAYPLLKHIYTACFRNHDKFPACCELLGVDIIFDKHLSPMVLEVNHSPSFHTDSEIDFDVKETLLTDMLSMMNLHAIDKQKIIREDRNRIRDRLVHGQTPIGININSYTEYFKMELANRGGFRLVYPVSNTEHLYAKYFEKAQNTFFYEITNDKPKLKPDIIKDNKELLLKQILPSGTRTHPVPTTVTVSSSDTSGTHPLKMVLKNTLTTTNNKNTIHSWKNSFNPQPIDELEERKRLKLLEGRDRLIRNYKIAKLLYLSFKQNKVLLSRDQRKHKNYEKLYNNNNNNAIKQTKI